MVEQPDLSAEEEAILDEIWREFEKDPANAERVRRGQMRIPPDDPAAAQYSITDPPDRDRATSQPARVKDSAAGGQPVDEHLPFPS